jgi:hypothetical protein
MSLDPDELSDGLLLAYLRHASAGPAEPADRAGEAAGWAGAVADALRPYGLPMWEAYPVGRYRIDIVVGEGDAAVGVECSIHPDGVDAHITRHLALRRVGWDLMAAMESRWLARPEDAAQAVAEYVIRRGSLAQTRPTDPNGQ